MKPRDFRVTTVRALAAAYAIDLTHHCEGPYANFDWATDEHGWFHAIERRNPRKGPAQARHACRTLRDLMAADMADRWYGTETYQRLELGLVQPNWLCDFEVLAWTPVADVQAAIAAIWTEGRPA